MIPERTSVDPAATTTNGVRGSPASRFIRSRRKTFSTSTTASSTSSPMAMARPPSVMVLIDSPKYLKTSAVIRIEIGIAVSEINVVRQLNRNRNSTIATTISASTRTRSTLPIDASIKFDCLNRMSFSRTSAGTTRAMSSRAVSISRVSFTVSALGCFWTERITAALPMKPASPRFRRGAKSTLATWCSGIGWPSRKATIRLRRSSSLAVRPMLRIRNSRPAWST